MVVIPTYNEVENIEKLACAILRLKIGATILFVDDNSSDGTTALARELAQRYQQVEVLFRPRKMGLGSAYVDGFRHALKHGAELIFGMDADFSHDPEALPNFLTIIRDYDLVIGSRYVADGRIEGWPLRRLLLSRLANAYAACLLPFHLYDYTSGFKCFRREVLESIDLDGIMSDGYAFQIEMHDLALRQGFRVKEIPIVFREREFGFSKISRRIVLEAFLLCLRLRAPVATIVKHLFFFRAALCREI